MEIPDKTYWGYIVRELGSTHIVFQTDDGQAAVRFCMDHPKPAKVIRTSDKASVYCNC